MKKIGEFIYPWGNGHYYRITRLNNILQKYVKTNFQIHFISKDHVYNKLLKKFPDKKKLIHNILMPTPLDGKKGPSVSLSLLNLFIPIHNKPSMIKQIRNYLINEGKLYDKEKFDIVINDGDIGSNILARKRKVQSIFITNQFMPKLWKSHFYFYPAARYISKQISKADKILVADSPYPYTICEDNLNFPEKIKSKVTYVGHFINKTKYTNTNTNIEKLIDGNDFGYWMRTGNKSTNEFTGNRYEKIFNFNEMKNEKRIISHANNINGIDCVTDINRKKYTINEAIEKKIEWNQIDIGFLSEEEKQVVLRLCKYAVINGSHTSIGEIIGINKKPVIGIPVYDEHTNHLRWLEKNQLGICANNNRQVIKAIDIIKNKYNRYIENLCNFSDSFLYNGAENTAKIINETLEDSRLIN